MCSLDVHPSTIFLGEQPKIFQSARRRSARDMVRGDGGKAAAKKKARKENSKVSKGRALQGTALGANVKYRAKDGRNTTGPEEVDKGLVGRAEVVEARRALATQTFTPEVRDAALPQLVLSSVVQALGIKIGQKKAPTSEGMQTIFAAEANMDVQKKLLAARLPFPEDLTPAVPTFDVSSQAAAAGMPLRPKWHRGMLPAMLHFRESKAFQRWMGEVKDAYQQRGGHLPVFEMNLQVWRQVPAPASTLCTTRCQTTSCQHSTHHMLPIYVPRCHSKYQTGTLCTTRRLCACSSEE